MKIEDISTIGICRISVASIRAGASHDSILVSQALFGERVVLIRTKNRSWCKVRCLWDDVEGWADPKQFWFSDEKNVSRWRQDCDTYAMDHFHGLSADDFTIPIMLGSNLYDCDGINVRTPAGNFRYSGQIVNLAQTRTSERLLINIARRFMHSPYLRGGRSLLGTDSSGFIQVVYKMMGMNLPRSVERISILGEDIGFLSECLPGDLAFFGSQGNPDHMGIVLGGGEVLHAFGRVKTDPFDQQGIYDTELKRYTFSLRSVRRLWSDSLERPPAEESGSSSF